MLNWKFLKKSKQKEQSKITDKVNNSEKQITDKVNNSEKQITEKTKKALKRWAFEKL